MKVRRAIKMLGIMTAALALFGCGVMDNYETAAVLQVVSNPGASVTVTDTEVTDNELAITVHNYPRAGLESDPIDLMVTNIDLQFVSGGTVIGYASAPGNHLVEANSDTVITVQGIVYDSIITQVRTNKSGVSYSANMIITAREINKSGILGNSMSITDSAAIVVQYSAN